MRIDAHHHLWRYNAEEFPWIGEAMTPLRRHFLPADLEAVITEAKVDATVAVQARCSLDETRFLLQCAAESPRIAKVVGWVPLASPDLSEVLEEFAVNPNLAGFREIAQDQPEYFLLTPDFNAGIRQLTARNYTYDLLIRERQLAEAIRLVDLHPQQRFVLDHAGKPEIAERRFQPWETRLRQLAERPNVFCKLSGLVTEADWQHWTDTEIEPYLDICLEAFGPSRLVAGSDWPVCLVASPYRRWWQLLERWTQRLTAGERARILGLNAAEFYGVDTEPEPKPEASQ